MLVRILTSPSKRRGPRIACRSPASIVTGPALPSAIFIAALRKEAVRPDVAMTGEISLRGLVLPVGGIKEKMIAAARAGIRKVILPARNRRDLEDIPQSARSLLEFVWVERVTEALQVALGASVPPEPKVTRPEEQLATV
jgi:ATP-dependent Lon protease